MENKEIWTSLEIAKFAVSLITPFLVGIITLFIARYTAKMEKYKSLNTELVKYRLKIFKEISPLLNDLFCFFTFVGKWKELDINTIIDHKRKCDKLIYINKSLFSDDFFNSYKTFMKNYFKMWNEVGQDAKIKIDKNKFIEHWDEQPAYNKKWLDIISDEPTETKTLKSSYYDLMKSFSKEVGLT